MERNMRILALTATATKELRLKISALLCMIEPHVIALSPDKGNIHYAIHEVGDCSVVFRHIFMGDFNQAYSITKDYNILQK